MNDRLARVYYADLTGVRAMMAIVSYLWAIVLFIHPGKTVANWPSLPVNVWGTLWLLFGTSKFLQLFVVFKFPLRMAVNLLGMGITTCWVYAYVSVGQFTPAPITFALAAAWMLMRTVRDEK